MNDKPKYNPEIHHRRSIRLQGYDYSQAGAYFITICCQDRISRFGHIQNGEMHLNEFGQIAHDEWIKLSERFPNFELDVFQIMPNHLHGIIVLKDINDNAVGAELAPALFPPVLDDISPIVIGAEASPAPTIADIIGAYKSLVFKNCLTIYKSKNEIMGKLWQRNYYEHIIRNEQTYLTIANYIITNPLTWNQDKFYL